MANVQVLLTNGILRMSELADQPDESFTAELVASSQNRVLAGDIATGREGNNACSSR
jgi:hypothetical protein